MIPLAKTIIVPKIISIVSCIVTMHDKIEMIIGTMMVTPTAILFKTLMTDTVKAITCL